MSLRPVDVPPAIRSAPRTARALSPEEIQDLRALPYEAYLRTAWWRSRRNLALANAGYRCTRCASKRQLEVHHTSYARLGAELDADLEVVCRGCHLGHHFNETQDSIAVYLRVLSDVIAQTNSDVLTDVLEEAKCRCLALRIPYRPDRFHAAVQKLLPRFPFTPPAHAAELYQTSAPGQPLTKAEAAGILAKLGAAAAMKHMPQVGKISLRRVEHLKAAKILAAGIVEQIQRCEEAERAAEQAVAAEPTSERPDR